MLTQVFFQLGHLGDDFFELSSGQILLILQENLMRDALEKLTTFNEALPDLGILPDLLADETLHHDDHERGELRVDL